MRIGIDARLIHETGVGRYIRNLISELSKIDNANTYIVFLKQEAFDSFVAPNKRWQKRLADVPWHSMTEQFIMPWLLVKEHLDFVHIPYFNVPIFYPGKYIVTIHDLTILHFDTGKASTLPLFMYKVRRLGYFLALAVGLRRASGIIAVSQSTKREIIDHFQIEPEKITVTYEGVEKNFKFQISNFKFQKRIIKEPYFLYVGNAYPHKNLETLLRAFQSLLQGDPLQNKGTPCKNVRLVLVGKEDFFYERLHELVAHLNITDSVIFYGPASDQQLSNLYAHAAVLVFPSFMEGFGLPALEALKFGCPVLCSDIPVFREILGDLPRYADPVNIENLATALYDISVNRPSPAWEYRAQQFVLRYSWSAMAQQTHELYVQNAT